MTSRPQNVAAPALAGYRKPDRGTQPDYLFPPYVSTVKRSPREPLVMLPMSLSEVTGPVFGPELIGPDDNDLTRHGEAHPIGERIVVSGRVLDANAKPVTHTLVEIWQANAAGRYRHRNDQHDAPLDRNFHGGGRTLTDAEGRYRFVTIKPGAYPWRNGYNAWRPAARRRSDVRERRRRKSASPTGIDVRLGNDDSREGARLPVRHRAARP